MPKKQPITAPLFSIGDLVRIRGFGVVLAATDIEIAIVCREPYSFKTIESYHELVYFEWWCYDLIIGTQLITMMPENFLIRIKTDEN